VHCWKSHKCLLVIIIGLLNRPVLFCFLASVVVVVGSVTLHARPAGGFSHTGQAMTSCCLHSNYSSMVTLHGRPVQLNSIKMTPCCMCTGSDSAHKTLKQGATVKARPNSKEVEDELASMRGTKDTGKIAYLERKPIHGICNVEEEPRIDTHSAASLGMDKEEETSTSRTSRDSSPALSRHMTKRYTMKSASDKGILCIIHCRIKHICEGFLLVDYYWPAYT